MPKPRKVWAIKPFTRIKSSGKIYQRGRYEEKLDNECEKT